jgi:endonuclease-3
MQFSLALEEKPFLARVRDRLLTQYGPQRDAERPDPISQLVNGIIGSQTRDTVSTAAFWRLRARYGSWDRLRHASPDEIERIIRPVTHAEKKAEELPQALRMIVAQCGSLDLDFLADWSEEMAMQRLKGLPGVGPKIAATVLNFSTLRMRALAVDTHLLRVGMQLGLLPPNAKYEIGHEVFMRLVPDDWDADALYEFHWLVKMHGQQVCRPSTPSCPRCSLRDLCPRRLSALAQFAPAR